MKTTIAVVACTLVGFTGMSLYLASPYASSTPPAKVAPQEATAPTPAAEKPAAPKPAPARETRPVKPAINPTPPKPAKTKRTESGNSSAKKQPASMYFTVEGVGKNGIPSRVNIHNTPIGKCTILLIGSSSSTGALFAGSGTIGSPAYKWEVKVMSGNVTVIFDGKNVRRGG